MTARLRSVLPPLAVVLILIGAWEAYVDVGSVDQFLLPAPHSVAQALWDNRSLLASNLGTTAKEVLIGITLSLAVGMLVAIVLHLSRTLRRAMYPLAVGSQAMPVVLLAPLLVFWWGFGIFPKLVVIALICFFPVVVTTLDGLAGVDPDQLKLLRTLDASRWQAFRFAEAPAALPAALSGAKIALAVAVIGAYIAETTAGSSAGLGHQMVNDITGLQTSRAWAAAAVLFVFAIACFYALALLERRLAPWAHRQRGAAQ